MNSDVQRLVEEYEEIVSQVEQQPIINENLQSVEIKMDDVIKELHQILEKHKDDTSIGGRLIRNKVRNLINQLYPIYQSLKIRI